MEEEEGAKRDRISELPEEIKEQIVSFLCMKEVVCTSSLSSVWRYSWVSLPFIDFGYDFFSKFTLFFRTLPATHPKKRHLYSVIHDDGDDDSEWTVDDTVDDSDFDYDYDAEYNDWITKHAWRFNHFGYLQTIDEFLQLYIEKNPSFGVLKKMSLYVPNLSDSKMRDYGAPIVSRCLSLAKHNVTELEYWIDSSRRLHHPKDSYYALQNCFPVLELKTLTKLELHGCYLATEKKADLPIDLPKLKHLSLIMFNVDDESMLENLIAQCRALEKLEFSSCTGFKVLRVPRVSKLKELEVRHVHDLDLVEINALEIQSLTLVNLNRNKCKVKMTSNACNNLVKLFVYGCGITDGFFNNVAEFPHLENVSLIDCPKLKHIKITGNSLTSLDIKECPNFSQAEVDTPELFFSGNSSSSKNNIKRLFSKRGMPRASSFKIPSWCYL